MINKSFNNIFKHYCLKDIVGTFINSSSNIVNEIVNNSKSYGIEIGTRTYTLPEDIDVGYIVAVISGNGSRTLSLKVNLTTDNGTSTILNSYEKNDVRIMTYLVKNLKSGETIEIAGYHQDPGYDVLRWNLIRAY